MWDHSPGAAPPRPLGNQELFILFEVSSPHPSRLHQDLTLLLQQALLSSTNLDKAAYLDVHAESYPPGWCLGALDWDHCLLQNCSHMVSSISLLPALLLQLFLRSQSVDSGPNWFTRSKLVSPNFVSILGEKTWAIASEILFCLA